MPFSFCLSVGGEIVLPCENWTIILMGNMVMKSCDYFFHSPAADSFVPFNSPLNYLLAIFMPCHWGEIQLTPGTICNELILSGKYKWIITSNYWTIFKKTFSSLSFNYSCGTQYGKQFKLWTFTLIYSLCQLLFGRLCDDCVPPP